MCSRQLNFTSFQTKGYIKILYDKKSNPLQLWIVRTTHSFRSEHPKIAQSSPYPQVFRYIALGWWTFWDTLVLPM